MYWLWVQIPSPGRCSSLSQGGLRLQLQRPGGSPAELALMLALLPSSLPHSLGQACSCRAAWCRADRHSAVDVPLWRAIYDEVLQQCKTALIQCLPGMACGTQRNAQHLRCMQLPHMLLRQGEYSSRRGRGVKVCSRLYLCSLGPCLVILWWDACPELLKLRQRGEVHLKLCACFCMREPLTRPSPSEWQGGRANG